MLRKAFIVAAALMLVPALAPAVSNAQSFQKGDWELTLAGSGSNNKGFTAGSFGVDASLGYFLSNSLEVGIRQNVNYVGAKGTSADWSGETRGAVDWNFDMGAFVPYIGGNIGYVYGHAVSDTWEAAPEAGVKYFVNKTTFIFFQAEYEFFFRNSGDISSGFKNGQFVYSLGLGVRL